MIISDTALSTLLLYAKIANNIVVDTTSEMLLPPSRMPYVFPWSCLFPQHRAALIIADHNIPALQIPHIENNIRQISKEGNVEKTNPAIAVTTSAIVISFRGENRSASHPPGK